MHRAASGAGRDRHEKARAVCTIPVNGCLATTAQGENDRADARSRVMAPRSLRNSARQDPPGQSASCTARAHDAALMQACKPRGHEIRLTRRPDRDNLIVTRPARPVIRMRTAKPISSVAAQAGRQCPLDRMTSARIVGRIACGIPNSIAACRKPGAGDFSISSAARLTRMRNAVW